MSLIHSFHILYLQRNEVEKKSKTYKHFETPPHTSVEIKCDHQTIFLARCVNNISEESHHIVWARGH